MRPLARLPLALAMAGALAAGGWASWLASGHMAGRAGPLDRIEAPLADLRLLIGGPRRGPRQVAIVAIDDRTINAEGGYPLDRARMASLLKAIKDAGARAAALDILFADPGPATSDHALAAALAGLPSVIAAAGLFDTDTAQPIVPASRQELWPQTGFAEAASVGMVNISSDSAGTPRHLPLIINTSRGLTPSLPLRAAGLFTRSEPVLASETVTLGEDSRRLDIGWSMPLRFYGPRGTITTISAEDVFAHRDSGRLTGRIAIVGVTATAIGDTFATPFDAVTPGVEVLATGIGNLIDGSGLVRDGGIRRIDGAAAVILAIGGVLAVCLLPPTLGLSVAAAALLGWLAAITVGFAGGYWFSAALPLAAALPPLGSVAALRQIRDRREARALAKAEEALRRFQPSSLVRRIETDPTFLAEPTEQNVAILFIDLAGFTGSSEKLGPVGTRALLKEFHTLVVNETTARGGVVMSFMGDGAMIVFGIPDASADDASRALRTAFSMIAATEAWIARADRATSVTGVRLGAHFGPVVLSRLGHDSHQHIAATGDSVNVTSRLLEVAKLHDATIAASSEIVAAAAIDGGCQGRPGDVREVAIRGRAEPMTVHLWQPHEILTA
ncbi:CHASE2 domain-containing protein [Aurantimonas sp. VKM B-3413]|uniref:CHASE2 domain-containing protein n=1 Tax=Aurantimonas sp. VKM B-3413 TaxID=2779401 RepID=UPI001E2935F8|nr:adenylate/guanylate cyclase domain-containing protein [Aurantimonas sp. VKM B-3413]MCB8837537.1 adenylate/guanylate cyclase domain-containing protein [Aurantimonas sp. VKM B-3413]